MRHDRISVMSRLGHLQGDLTDLRCDLTDSRRDLTDLQLRPDRWVGHKPVVSREKETSNKHRSPASRSTCVFRLHLEQLAPRCQRAAGTKPERHTGLCLLRAFRSARSFDSNGSGGGVTICSSADLRRCPRTAPAGAALSMVPRYPATPTASSRKTSPGPRAKRGASATIVSSRRQLAGRALIPARSHRVAGRRRPPRRASS